MKIDNDLKVAYPLYFSTIYIMLGFEWRKALSQRKTSWSNDWDKQVEQSQPLFGASALWFAPSIYAI